jgi:hypothetical protein
MKITLTYFKAGGKYYTEGEHETELNEFYSIIDEVKRLRREGKLPGLVRGADEFMIHLVVHEVPHIIPLYGPIV